MKKNTLTIANVKTFLSNQTGDLQIRVNLGRNKFENHSGKVVSLFPAVFTFQTENYIKTYSYAQVLAGNIKFKKGTQSETSE